MTKKSATLPRKAAKHPLLRAVDALERLAVMADALERRRANDRARSARYRARAKAKAASKAKANRPAMRLAA